MSRIGKLPISLPKGVTIQIDKNEVQVKGPKGELNRTFSPDMTLTLENGQLTVARPTDQRHHRALHGLTRALLNNMVLGVSTGFTRELALEGVGYRAQTDGSKLILSVGYSHPVTINPPATISFEVDKTGRSIVVKGCNKEEVGQVAANIREVRPPEPYKGKGIMYKGEVIRRKAGKAGKK